MSSERITQIIQQSADYGPDAQSYVIETADIYKKLHDVVSTYIAHMGHCDDSSEGSMCGLCHAPACAYCTLASAVGPRCSDDCSDEENVSKAHHA
jgi:hypothetical protein